jgi:hypothetical protein
VIEVALPGARVVFTPRAEGDVREAAGLTVVEALAGALGPAEQARRWLDELRDVHLEISGDDLLAEGIAPGPEMGRRLDRALAAKLDGEAPDRDTELGVALA